MVTHQIGLFISRCRKEKNMTQKQLADIVGVSDKSVSKWERGINLPESSLFIPLCEVLDIQVQEVLLGEHIEQKELLQKSNELLVDLSKQQDQEAATTVKFIGFFILFPIIFISIMTTIPYEDFIGIIDGCSLICPFTFMWGFIRLIESLMNNKPYFRYFLVTSFSLFILFLYFY